MVVNTLIRLTYFKITIRIMAKINFGGVEENVVTREEFPIDKARELLAEETLAVVGYGVQGPGQDAGNGSLQGEPITTSQKNSQTKKESREKA